MTHRDLRMLSIAVLVTGAVTWCAATSDYSPIKPEEPKRPILRFLGKVAKLGLWVMWAAEPAPQQEGLVYHAQQYDADGNRVLDHAKGW
jgi:hypothetical protein